MARTLSASELALTADRAREVLRYEPFTGVFTRAVWPRAGQPTGAKHSAGYTQLSIDGKLYRAHRVAWLYVTGRWPTELIDHINGVKDDNRLSNLREATESQNHHNARVRRHNRIGLKGVQQVGSRSFSARITVAGKFRYIGTFSSPEAAHMAYCNAATRHFGSFANEGGVFCR